MSGGHRGQPKAVHSPAGCAVAPKRSMGEARRSCSGGSGRRGVPFCNCVSGVYLWKISRAAAQENRSPDRLADGGPVQSFPPRLAGSPLPSLAPSAPPGRTNAPNPDIPPAFDALAPYSAKGTATHAHAHANRISPDSPKKSPRKAPGHRAEHPPPCVELHPPVGQVLGVAPPRDIALDGRSRRRILGGGPVDPRSTSKLPNRKRRPVAQIETGSNLGAGTERSSPR